MLCKKYHFHCTPKVATPQAVTVGFQRCDLFVSTGLSAFVQKRKGKSPGKIAVDPEPGSVSHPISNIGAVRLNIATGPRLLPLKKDKHKTWHGQEIGKPPREGITHNPRRPIG